MNSLKSLLCAAALSVLGLAALTAQADEASVRKLMEANFPGKIESVSKAPLPGLYEVNVAGDIMYTDEKGTYALAGHLFDIKAQKDLTQATINQYQAQQYAKLPFDLAIKTVRGNGKRVLVTFEDPFCGYCKKLAKEIQSLNDVTVYTFLYPIFGPDSDERAKTIFCAPDRYKVWYNWMVNDKEPPKADCKAPIDKLKDLGRKFKVRGTPALLFANGELIPSYMPAAKLEENLARVAAAK